MSADTASYCEALRSALRDETRKHVQIQVRKGIPKDKALSHQDEKTLIDELVKSAAGNYAICIATDDPRLKEPSK